MGSIVRRNLSPHLMHIDKDNPTHNSSASVEKSALLPPPAQGPSSVGDVHMVRAPLQSRVPPRALHWCVVDRRLCLLIMYPCVL